MCTISIVRHPFLVRCTMLYPSLFWVGLHIADKILLGKLFGVRHTPGQVQDVVILLTQPNFFLWISLGDYVNGLGTFWAAVFFFGNSAFEQYVARAGLLSRLCNVSGPYSIYVYSLCEITRSVLQCMIGYGREKDLSRIEIFFVESYEEQMIWVTRSTRPGVLLSLFFCFCIYSI